MAELSRFDRLASTLSSSERQELLEKVRRSLTLSTEPLQAEPEEPPVADVDEELRRFKPLRLFWLFLKTVFTGQDRRALVSEELRRKLQVRLERRHRGLADFRAGLFLDRMHEELQALRDCAFLFREPLHQALGSRKHDFFAFLAGTELAEFQERLVLETDPLTLQSDAVLLDDTGIRTEMFSRLDSLVGTIPQTDKERVYLEARALHALHGLSSQPFDAMLACFSPMEGVPGRACEFFRLKRYLPALADSLQAARFPPSPDALRNLFLFFNQDRLERAEFDLEERLIRYFGQTEDALSGIREFNARVPLAGMIRATSGNLGYVPRATGGGEDWLVLYREFWRRRLEEKWQAFRNDRLHARLTGELLQLAGLQDLPELEHYRTGARHALSVSALLGFRRSLLPRLYRPLKLILLQGEFYKAENRREYDESFHRLERLGENLEEMDRRLSPTGELGLADLKPAEVREQADRQARALIHDAEALLESLVRLLEGILRGDPGAPYDTLVNFGTLGGSENPQLVRSWKEALDRICRTLQLLRSIRDLERGA